MLRTLAFLTNWCDNDLNSKASLLAFFQSFSQDLTMTCSSRLSHHEHVKYEVLLYSKLNTGSYSDTDRGSSSYILFIILVS